MLKHGKYLDDQTNHANGDIKPDGRQAASLIDPPDDTLGNQPKDQEGDKKITEMSQHGLKARL